jgi:ComEC/Rec2-related protein
MVKNLCKKGFKPPLFASICLLLALYALPPSLFTIVALFLIVLFISGTAITLLSINRRKSLILFTLSAGFLLGLYSHTHFFILKNSCYTGIPINQIQTFKGILLEDTTFCENDESNLTIHKLKLISVSPMDQSTSAEADGRIILYDKSEQYFHSGEIIFVRGKIWENKEDLLYPLSCSPNSIQREGYSHWYFSIRSALLKQIENRINAIGYPASGLFMGLFLGKKQNIPKNIYSGFKNTGTLHLLALSGLHVGIIYLLILLLIKPLPFRSLKWISGSIFVLFYLFLTGAKPSLMRASIMIILSGFNLLIDREYNPLNILSLTLLIIIFFDPVSAYTISFQLSFAGLFGILYIGRLLMESLKHLLPPIINIPLSATIGAQVATLPLVLFYFGYFYPISIVVTLLLIPCVTIFIWSGLISLILLCLPITLLHDCARWLMGILFEIITTIVNIFSNVPGIQYNKTDTFWVSAIIIIFLCMVFYYLRRLFLRKYFES